VSKGGRDGGTWEKKGRGIPGNFGDKTVKKKKTAYGGGTGLCGSQEKSEGGITKHTCNHMGAQNEWKDRPEMRKNGKYATKMVHTGCVLDGLLEKKKTLEPPLKRPHLAANELLGGGTQTRKKISQNQQKRKEDFFEAAFEFSQEGRKVGQKLSSVILLSQREEKWRKRSLARHIVASVKGGADFLQDHSSIPPSRKRGERHVAYVEKGRGKFIKKLNH